MTNKMQYSRARRSVFKLLFPPSLQLLVAPCLCFSCNFNPVGSTHQTTITNNNMHGSLFIYGLVCMCWQEPAWNSNRTTSGFRIVSSWSVIPLSRLSSECLPLCIAVCWGNHNNSSSRTLPRSSVCASPQKSEGKTKIYPESGIICCWGFYS